MAKQFKVGDMVKFASCGPSYAVRTCEKCNDCVADAHKLVEKRTRSCDNAYVHGTIVDIERKFKHRGTLCLVKVRKRVFKRKEGDNGDVSTSVQVPMWLLRSSKKVIDFLPTVKEVEGKTGIFNPFSII